MADINVTVIGAGVVGLAIAARLAEEFPPLYVIERHEKYGQETSSRNSEVIHAGLYYAHDSLKAKLCLQGNKLLYELCTKNDIPHRRLTKIITATDKDQLTELDRLYNHGVGNGVELMMLTAQEVKNLEPNIVSVGAILSPSTGIISAHALMDYFYHTAKARGAEIQTHCEVVSVEKRTTDFLITIKEEQGHSSFTSERVINAAGLESDAIARSAGIDVDAARYRLHYCKGNYFALPSSLSRLVSRLVYPVPPKESLGVHALLDLGGRLKFGPDVEYLGNRTLDYRVDESKRQAFAASVRNILPMVKDDDLAPDLSGIRPKLQAKGESPRDFVICEEKERGLSGMINLIGIESPGLTASPAIAVYVEDLLRSS